MLTGFRQPSRRGGEVPRRAHNPEFAGSNPAVATTDTQGVLLGGRDGIPVSGRDPFIKTKVMIKLRLKGDLEPELPGLGLKPGDEVMAEQDPVSKVGCMHFHVMKLGDRIECSVWPENYDIIAKNIL